MIILAGLRGIRYKEDGVGAGLSWFRCRLQFIGEEVFGHLNSGPRTGI